MITAAGELSAARTGPAPNVRATITAPTATTDTSILGPADEYDTVDSLPRRLAAASRSGAAPARPGQIQCAPGIFTGFVAAAVGLGALIRVRAQPCAGSDRGMRLRDLRLHYAGSRRS